jgi:hypothetical protein
MSGRCEEKALGSEQVLTYIPALNTMQDLAFLLSSVGRADEAKELEPGVSLYKLLAFWW